MDKSRAYTIAVSLATASVACTLVLDGPFIHGYAFGCATAAFLLALYTYMDV